MAEIPSQKIAEWVIARAEEQWIRLDELCFLALKKQMGNASEDYLASLVEKELGYVVDILCEISADASMRGEVSLFEIDQESPPYIRAKERESHNVLRRLRRVSPKRFEEICSEILVKFGAIGSVTGNPYDMGVDFIGKNIAITCDGLPSPISAQVIVVGQAKRYCEKGIISETDLRKFIGGATRRVHQLKKKSEIGALTPVIYAYWTSSDFDKNAKDFAHETGLWLMNGVTMAVYLSKLNLLDRLAEEEGGEGGGAEVPVTT